MKYSYFSCFLLLFVFYSSSFGQPTDQEAKMDALLTELFPANEAGGTALVSQNGKVIYRKAFGKANLELDVDMKSEHIFRIGSITKQFTACAILRLAEQGKLSLDDEITKFIPDYPTHDHKITVEHLLTHTSGIKSYTSMEKFFSEMGRKDMKPMEIIDFFKNEEMDFAPDEKWSYNNSGYILLGYIIEHVSGKTYEDYVESEFFAPLDMKSSYYDNNSEVVAGRVAGYTPSENGVKNADYLSMTLPYAAGSLMSNVDDLQKWYEAVFAGKVINPESMAKAHAGYKLNDGEDTGYGYGWGIGNIQGSRMITHGGGINGFLTASLYLPSEKIFVAIFSNCNCHAPGVAANKIAAIALGKPYEWTAITLDPEKLQEYVAVYEKGEEQRIISSEEGKIYSMRSGGARQEIFPYTNDKFFFENSVTTLEFIRDASGTIRGVNAYSTSAPEHWKRTDKIISGPEPIELAESIIQKYIGKYELVPGFVISISLEDGKCFAQATGQPKIEIVPFEQNKFFLKDMDVQLEFNTTAEGTIDSLTLHQNGEQRAKKIE